MWGDFGLRMKDHDRRMPASALKIAEETIKRRLRGMNYKLYKRVSANIGVYTKGNEQRMVRVRVSSTTGLSDCP